MAQPELHIYLHDNPPRGCIGPVVVVLEAQDDVLLLLHLGAHHGLHLLGEALKSGILLARGCRDETCGNIEQMKSL